MCTMIWEPEMQFKSELKDGIYFKSFLSGLLSETEFGHGCGNWVLRLSLLLQAKENLWIVWKFYLHQTAPWPITLPFHPDSGGSGSSNVLPSCPGLHWCFLSCCGLRRFIYAIILDIVSGSSYCSSVLSVVPVFYHSSWPPLSLLWVIWTVIYNTCLTTIILFL